MWYLDMDKQGRVEMACTGWWTFWMLVDWLWVVLTGADVREIIVLDGGLDVDELMIGSVHRSRCRGSTINITEVNGRRLSTMFKNLWWVVFLQELWFPLKVCSVTWLFITKDLSMEQGGFLTGHYEM